MVCHQSHEEARGKLTSAATLWEGLDAIVRVPCAKTCACKSILTKLEALQEVGDFQDATHGANAQRDARVMHPDYDHALEHPADDQELEDISPEATDDDMLHIQLCSALVELDDKTAATPFYGETEQAAPSREQHSKREARGS